MTVKTTIRTLLSLPLVAVLAVLALAPTPALASLTTNEACPNEALRAENEVFRKGVAEVRLGEPVASVNVLPDCRAYEEVSPPYKQGYEPKLVAISADGEHLLMRSFGGFAGLEGGDTGVGAEYELSRSPSGWVVAPVSPSQALLPYQFYEGASPDLTKTLFIARSGSESIEAANFYIHEANGTTNEVGPLYPPYATAGPPAGEYDSSIYSNDYRAASSELGHVFYNIEGAAHNHDGWPGDTTVEYSLLEYSGIGNSEPALVGVKPGETKDRPSEEPALVSTCSTYLGAARSNELYNAVSADGASVFFTAEHAGCSENGVVGTGPEVNELYARLDEDKTVPISEPSAEACAECQEPATEAEGRREGVFAGASEDGSKVLFLTEQELLTRAKGMNLYEYDFDNPTGSSKIVRVSTGSVTPEVEGVARVSEDGSHVYFVAKGVLTGGQGNAYGAAAQPGKNNLYVSSAGRVTFIATLSSESEAELKVRQEACTGGGEEKEECENAARREFEAKNRADASDWRGEDERPVQATPDGRFVVFMSAADLTPGDTSEKSQVFEYDAVTGELVRVSRGASNDEPEGTVSADANESIITAQAYADSTSPAAAGAHLAVSGDGAVVVFGSAGALTGGAVAATELERYNSYEYRSSVGEGGSIGVGDVYLIAPPAEEVPQVDESGEDVFFLSGVALVSQETDSQFDIYDARVDGGFPAPVSPASCAGEGCQGVTAPAPVFTAPGSVNLPGNSNLAPAPAIVPPSKPMIKKTATKCRKGFTKKHNKCVRNKKKKKKSKAKRSVHTNRRAK